MSISATPKAAIRIRKAHAKRGGGVGLRAAIKTNGCSGYVYALEFVEAANAEDLSFESVVCRIRYSAGPQIGR
jgi:iron-sulfur cluster assembly protein